MTFEQDSHPIEYSFKSIPVSGENFNLLFWNRLINNQ